MSPRLSFALSAALLTGVSAAALAHDTEEVVVTAPLEGSRIESLQGVEVLRREDIVERLHATLGEVLSGLPGISSTFYGAGAGRPIIRGLGDDRIRVLENGIGTIDASSASPDHAVGADPLDARRIEVLRGAAALAYGGNAVGGVVNVIDETIPTRTPERGWEARGLLSYSTVDDGWQGALGLTAATGGLVFNFDYAARNSGDYDIPGFAESWRLRALEDLEHEHEEGEGHHDDEDAHHEDEAHGVAPNSFVETRSYAGGASWVGDWGFVGVGIKRYETDYGLPGHEHGHEEEHEHDAGEDEHAEGSPFIALRQTRYELRGDIRVDWGPFTRFDFAGQISDYGHTEFEAPGEPGTVFSNDGFEGRLELHNGGRGDRLTGATGVQFSRTDFEAIGDEAFLTPTQTRDVGVFTVQRWDQGDWGLEGGLRLEHRDVDNLVSGIRDFTAVSASAGAFWRPAEGWFAGVTLARTERAPTGPELFADGPHLATSNYEIGDPSLDIETALSIEGSLRYASDAWSFEASVYHIAFDGYIGLVPTGEEDEDHHLPIFAFVQRDARFTGGEISARVRLGDVGGLTFSADAAADIVRARFDGGGDLPRIPPRTVTLGVEAESEMFGARVEMVDIAAQDRVADFELPTDGSTVLNAGLSWRPIPDQDLTVRLDGRNLTDEEVRVHASFLKDQLPRPGRSVRVSILARY